MKFCGHRRDNLALREHTGQQGAEPLGAGQPGVTWAAPSASGQQGRPSGL
jgi:hypothetical protein